MLQFTDSEILHLVQYLGEHSNLPDHVAVIVEKMKRYPTHAEQSEHSQRLPLAESNSSYPTPRSTPSRALNALPSEGSSDALNVSSHPFILLLKLRYRKHLGIANQSFHICMRHLFNLQC
jgi:hypothetical protein